MTESEIIQAQRELLKSFCKSLSSFGLSVLNRDHATIKRTKWEELLKLGNEVKIFLDKTSH